MAAIEARAASCAHCGKQLLAPKRCSICKQVSYCGTECQKAGWKRHKKTCEPPLPRGEVLEKIFATHEADDWWGVLKWEGRIEELLEGQPYEICACTLGVFAEAHELGFKSTGNSDHSRSVVRLEERRVELRGKMERFRDQGEALCSIGDKVALYWKDAEAETYFQKARDLGVKHGFLSVECRACLGLGTLAMSAGRQEEGLDLLRNAVAAAPLNEADEIAYELNALRYLIDALFLTNAIDELEPLVSRYREAIRANSRTIGRLSSAEVRSLCFSARLHEVPCSLVPCGKSSHCLALASPKADSICCALHRARVMTHALLEPPALCRHAEGPKRPKGRFALCSAFCARIGQQCTTWRATVLQFAIKPPSTSRFSIR